MRRRWSKSLSALFAAASLGVGGVGVALAQGNAQPQQQPAQGQAPQPQQQQQQQQTGTAVVEVDLEGQAQGVQGQCPNVRFSLGGFSVQTDAQTEWDDGSCQDLVEGMRVEVDGITGTEGGVRAREVDLD